MKEFDSFYDPAYWDVEHRYPTYPTSDHHSWCEAARQAGLIQRLIRKYYGCQPGCRWDHEWPPARNTEAALEWARQQTEE